MPINERHEYLSDDRDGYGAGGNCLVIMPAENGDWYVSVLKPGDRVGEAVRITTSGSPPGLHKVAVHIRAIYDLLPKTEER